jgi:uncharacterized protein (TIGR03435 family)
MRPFCAIALALCAAAALTAQTFEVATVKRNLSGPNAPNAFSPEPGRLVVTNMPLDQMLQATFHIRTGMLIGATGWMTSDRYDIEGKAPGVSKFDDQMVMLKALLIERFQLKFHTETRQLTMLYLVKGKSGPKFTPSAEGDGKEHINIRPTQISGTNIPFGHFVSILEAQLSRPIKNDTGISGDFDLSLKYVKDDAPNAAEGPSVFAAVEEQLGLKLESRKGPAEVLVIDSAQRPGEN